MKYIIHYSCPNDIYRYEMTAKNEKQLVTFLKMLTDEKAYNFQIGGSYEVEKEKLYTAQLKSTGEFLYYDKETDKVHHFCAYGNTARNSKNYHFNEDTLIQYNAWKNGSYDVNEVEE